MCLRILKALSLSNHSYIPIAQRSATDQLKPNVQINLNQTSTYIMLGIWFSFQCINNFWTLTTAHDFLGGLGIFFRFGAHWKNLTVHKSLDVAYSQNLLDLDDLFIVTRAVRN